MHAILGRACKLTGETYLPSSLSLTPLSQSLSPEMFLKRGDSDAVVPSSQSFHSLLSTACSDFGVDERDLMDSLEQRVELWLVQGAGHGDVEQKAGVEFYARLNGFINKVLNPQAARATRRNSN